MFKKNCNDVLGKWKRNLPVQYNEFEFKSDLNITTKQVSIIWEYWKFSKQVIMKCLSREDLILNFLQWYIE